MDINKLGIETNTRLSLINKSIVESHQTMFSIIDNLTKENEALKAENEALKKHKDEVKK